MTRGRDGGRRLEGSAGTLERWAAILGGTALGFAGARRGSWTLAALGGGLFLAGAAGVPLSSPLRQVALPAMRREPTTTQANVTIAVPANKLFRHWRNVRHLAALFPHLDAVEILSDTESRWKAHGPGGVPVVWNSRLDKVRENELITWHTLEGADLPHRGTVLFRPAPGGRGTEVSLTLAYHPPGGAGGDAVSRLFGAAPEQQAREALRRLKRIMEVGELPTIEGQPSGRAERGRVTAKLREVTG
ncbi:putative membrane protein [Azospirillum sp. OGB3]|uniref:SRPBCC family protein n=1 Tax=Azospirillum sp. OGB3 TaxID=2587012 RepID=UPI0016068F9D|nr:SRPBCC family protein [Azospirillum sp. OGB3]MBB3263479.1 putative membrane protein [Azospirillum sp. OGB3]